MKRASERKDSIGDPMMEVSRRECASECYVSGRYYGKYL